jgi:hypothetical protein
MSDQLIPDGTYTVMGPGGQLTMDSAFVGVAMWQPEGKPTQQWKVACKSGTYTLRNVASDLYLGNDGDPNAPAMVVKGTKQAFGWKLSTGDDSREETLVLTSAASSEGLVLTMSLLRIFPPLVAILQPRSYDVEWVFEPV